MAHRFPGALWVPISRNYTPRRRSVTRGIILHVAAGETKSLRGWFNNPASKASSHFYVRYDGTIEQYVDLDQISWTSGAASATTIGVETEGLATGKWTPAQLSSLIRIITYCARHYGFPLQLMQSSRAGERGVGWHSLGVPATRAQKAAGVSQTGGQLWSSAAGKVCPGSQRIAQIPALVDAARTGHAPAQPQPQPQLKPNLPAALKAAGVEIGEEMIAGIFWPEDEKTTVYALLDLQSGAWVAHSRGTGNGPMDGDYNNALAKAFGTAAWAPVSKAHAKSFERMCAEIRKAA